MVSVAENHHLEHVKIPVAHSRVYCVQVFDQTWLKLLSKRTNYCANAIVILKTFTLREVRLKNGLEVESNCSKAGTFEEKIELHIFFGSSYTLFLWLQNWL